MFEIPYFQKSLSYIFSIQADKKNKMLLFFSHLGHSYDKKKVYSPHITKKAQNYRDYFACSIKIKDHF